METIKWKFIKLWLELDDTSVAVSSAVVGSMGMQPTPRYGHAMVMDSNGIISIFGGSGSMYLNDIFQIDTETEEEDEDDE